MKKKAVLISIVAAVIIIVVAAVAVWNNWDNINPYSNTLNGWFSIEHEYYEDIINREEFKPKWFREQGISDIEDYVDPIHKPSEARRAAEKVWLDVYDDWCLELRPYYVSYDEKNRTYEVVCRGMAEHMDTGVPHIIIKESGEIVAIYYKK